MVGGGEFSIPPLPPTSPMAQALSTCAGASLLGRRSKKSQERRWARGAGRLTVSACAASASMLWQTGSVNGAAKRPAPQDLSRRMNEAAEAGDVEKTELLFQQLRTNQSFFNKSPRMFYNTVIKACANAGLTERAEYWSERLRAARLEMNPKGRLAG
eukprot:s2582_g18.t1